MARYDDIDTKFVFFATLVSCLLLVAILQGTQALCYFMANAEEARKLGSSEYVESTKVISEQQASLTGYQKVAVPPASGSDGKANSEKPSTKIQIPLDRAAELLLEEAKKNAEEPPAKA